MSIDFDVQNPLARGFSDNNNQRALSQFFYELVLCLYSLLNAYMSIQTKKLKENGLLEQEQYQQYVQQTTVYTKKDSNSVKFYFCDLIFVSPDSSFPALVHERFCFLCELQIWGGYYLQWSMNFDDDFPKLYMNYIRKYFSLSFFAQMTYIWYLLKALFLL